MLSEKILTDRLPAGFSPGGFLLSNLPLASGCYAANIPAHEYFKKSLYGANRLHIGGER